MNRNTAVQFGLALLLAFPVFTVFQNCSPSLKADLASEAPSLFSLTSVSIKSNAELYSSLTTQTLTFSPSESAQVSSYKCALDVAPLQACSSPLAQTGITQGSHVFKVEAYGSAGEVVGHGEYRFNVDFTPPVAVINSISAVAGTTDYSVAFSATDNLSAGVFFECFVDGVSKGSCFSPFVISALSYGTHSFGVIAKDRTENISAKVQQDFPVSAGPQITVGNVAAYSGATATIAFSVSSNTTPTVTCSLDNGAASACSTSYVASGLVPGPHFLNITATDTLAQSATARVQWTADVAVPQVNFISQPPAVIGRSGYSADFVSSDNLQGSGVDFCECKTGTAAAVRCTSPVSVPYTTDGSKTLSVVCVDKVGNRSTAATLDLLFEGSSPTIAFAPGFPVVGTTSVNFNFAVSDPSGGTPVLYISYDGGTPYRSTNPFTLNYSGGKHRIVAVAKDSAGNSSAELSFAWPSEAPLAAGEKHSCAVVNGSLKCWGNNDYYQLGDASGNARLSPVNIISAGVSDVYAAANHTCALVNGGLKCWGYNGYGQLGDATKTTKMQPVSIIASGVTAASTGPNHTCAVVGGALKCWGRNVEGQLGDGTKVEKLSPATIIASGVTSVAAGTSHTCAVVAGALQCWGSNNTGQLGDGSKTAVLLPKTVITAGVTAVAAGPDFTCAIVNASLYCWGSSYMIDNDPYYPKSLTPAPIIEGGVTAVSVGSNHTCVVVLGSLKCFGSNQDAQLGDGTKVKSAALLSIIPAGVTGVTAGVTHSCALVSGLIKCWGYNGDGQLGDGSIVNKVFPVVAVSSGATKVAVGGSHSCALISGALNCWGQNGFGQLGSGKVISEDTPVVIIPENVTGFSLGYTHTCAIESGALKCWGQNVYGQVGSGSTSTVIRAPALVIAEDVKKISLHPSSYSSCAVVGDSVQCWGDNSYGQLGDDTVIKKIRPVVAIATGAVDVSVGERHACAIMAGGELKCWGANTNGQLGDSTLIDKHTPVTVISSGVTAVAAGNDFTCAIINRAMQCWGNNAFGQLGDGTLVSSNSPKAIIAADVTAISAGSNYGCAIVASALKCWGNNTGGLGDGTLNPQTTPKTIISSGVRTISAGIQHTCATNSVGALLCWGNNKSGQLGDGSTWKELPQSVLGL